MRDTILEEDDCAPDAREFFIKDMKEKFDLNFGDFFKEGIRTEVDELCTQYRYKGYVLEFNGDDPYYLLYEDI